MTFLDCLAECAKRPDFVREYDRVCNRNMASVIAGLQMPIDEASMFAGKEVAMFAAFVYKVVWARLPPEEKGKVTT